MSELQDECTPLRFFAVLATVGIMWGAATFVFAVTP